MSDLSKSRVAVLGAGKMGGILLQAFLKQQILSPDRLFATVAHAERAAALSSQWGIEVSTDNVAIAGKADVILIGVKPFQVPALVEEIRPALTADKLLISFAASVRTEAIERAAVEEVPVIRAMPNTPSMLGAGISALCRGRYRRAAAYGARRKPLRRGRPHCRRRRKAHGRRHRPLRLGPAFIYIILESLAEAGVKVGLPRDIATLLAAQTTYGAAKMVLETGYHPALLKDAVTTPAGCTIDGILELEEGGLRVTLIKAVMRATQRAKELAAG